MPKIIDSHCHLDFNQFDADRDQVIRRAEQQGIKAIVVPAVDINSSRRILELCDQYDLLYGAVGVHPNSSADWQDEWTDELRALAQHEKVVAIGEIGLDFYRDHSPHTVQKQAFRLQLALAATLNLPVIVHNREASSDVLGMLEESALVNRSRKGVLHSFSSDWEVAQEALAMGYYMGFTGPITYKKADDLRSVARQAPLDRVLVETDSPFLAPQKYRGKRNEPQFVTEVVVRLAAERSLSYDEIARQTTQNAINLFRIKVTNDSS
jgi:TatD DNase family protein